MDNLNLKGVVAAGTAAIVSASGAGCKADGKHTATANNQAGVEMSSTYEDKTICQADQARKKTEGWENTGNCQRVEE